MTKVQNILLSIKTETLHIYETELCKFKLQKKMHGLAGM